MEKGIGGTPRKTWLADTEDDFRQIWARGWGRLCAERTEWKKIVEKTKTYPAVCRRKKLHNIEKLNINLAVDFHGSDFRNLIPLWSEIHYRPIVFLDTCYLFSVETKLLLQVNEYIFVCIHCKVNNSTSKLILLQNIKNFVCIYLLQSKESN